MANSKPRLRDVDVTHVRGDDGQPAVMLRDTEGIAPGYVLIPRALVPVVARFDGARSLAQIATELGVSSADVERIADQLDEALLLDSPRFARERERARRTFAESPVRAATHAGGAYHDDPAKLTRYIERDCLAQASPRAGRGRMVGLSAPHMDLWRAAEGYGHAYRACADALAPEVDTVILLGTCHAAMGEPFALCDKDFATPLGALEVDHDLVGELQRAARFDARKDEHLHKQEHSLELQAVFLKHLLGARPARIVPILCGLGEAQSRRIDPRRLDASESFLAALAELCERLRSRILIVSGADMAHVGPRFGDARALDQDQRQALEARDLASIACATGGDASAFFDDVSSDLSTRRVCGLGPIYTLLRALPGEVHGELLHYAQHIDPTEGSIVSHAGLGFYA